MLGLHSYRAFVHGSRASERLDPRYPFAMDSPRGGADRPSAGRQPSLAEEIDEVEREQKVTKALQAQVDSHSITT